MDIFNYENYKLFVLDWIKEKPKFGRGEFKRISDFLKVSSVLISQIFKGQKEISTEQAIRLCDYLGLIELEKKYFISLVSISRAGTHVLKEFYRKDILELKQFSKDISKRVSNTKFLSREDSAIFYSDWKYSAIRLACGLNNITKTKIREYFHLDDDTLERYFEFLQSRNLIISERGLLKLGPSSTHLSKSSPFVKQHHRNWRIKSVESIDKMKTDEIMYTAPMCISSDLYDNFNRKILKLIDDIMKDAKESKADNLFYFNIDLRRMN